MIIVNKYNQIIGYHNEAIVKIANYFLIYNEVLKEISLPNVRIIAKYFLCHNNKLERMYAPNLKKLGAGSLLFNHNIEEIESVRYKDSRFIKRRIKKERRLENER